MRRVRLTTVFLAVFLVGHVLGPVGFGSATVQVCRNSRFGQVCWTIPRG